MKIALLGLAQTGKKTLFSLLTGRNVPETLKPGESLEGVALIQDPRIDSLSKMYNPKKKVYAENTFVLCPDITDNSQSREWMVSAKRCDLLCILIRAFDSANVFHPAGSVDPERDKEMIISELLLTDMQLIDTRLQRLAKEKKGGQSAAQALEEDILLRFNEALEQEQLLSTVKLLPHEEDSIRNLDLITRIPLLITYNISEDDIGKESPDGSLSISCEIEGEIATIEDPEERKEFMDELGLKEPSLVRVNAALYKALGLMSFYTVGKDECRAWSIKIGSTAPVAGGKIHSDIERGFIRAEVIKYDDLINAGSEQTAKSTGKMQLCGKDYTIGDGDICNFLFNV
jgi:ribosome-binding ATPase